MRGWRNVAVAHASSHPLLCVALAAATWSGVKPNRLDTIGRFSDIERQLLAVSDDLTISTVQATCSCCRMKTTRLLDDVCPRATRKFTLRTLCLYKRLQPYLDIRGLWQPVGVVKSTGAFYYTAIGWRDEHGQAAKVDQAGIDYVVYAKV